MATLEYRCMMVSSQTRTPCKFVIIKYVDDLVREEPVNVGVILQTEITHDTLFRSVATYPNWLSRNSRVENTTMMLEMLKRMEEEINSEKNSSEIIHKISSKYSTRFRFSEPRGAIPSNLDEEVQTIFEKYVSLKNRKPEWDMKGMSDSFYLEAGRMEEGKTIFQSEMLSPYLTGSSTTLLRHRRGAYP
ncbi:MAG: DUF3037 domain-containing protein [Candidatus Nitrosopolaris sp.]